MDGARSAPTARSLAVARHCYARTMETYTHHPFGSRASAISIWRSSHARPHAIAPVSCTKRSWHCSASAPRLTLTKVGSGQRNEGNRIPHPYRARSSAMPPTPSQSSAMPPRQKNSWNSAPALPTPTMSAVRLCCVAMPETGRRCNLPAPEQTSRGGPTRPI